MAVSKLKSIAILVLVAANLILLGLLLPNRAAQRRQDVELRESLCELYAGEGIALPAERIPQSRTLYALQLTASTSDQLRAATALLGAQAVLQEPAQYGYLKNFQSAVGTCTIGWEGNFLAELSGIEKKPEEVLEEMGFTWSSLETEDGVCKAVQSVLGAPVFSDGLQLHYEDGLLVRVEGTFCTGSSTPARIGRDSCMSAADALVRFLNQRYSLGWVGKEILSLEQGYALISTASVVNMEMTPVWILVTDTGTFTVDGLTGEIHSVS